MSAMQPGSGGPYSDLRTLRFYVRELKHDLLAKPMSKKIRKEVENELAEKQAKLKALNTRIKAMKQNNV